MKAIIYPARGQYANQFYFVLHGNNNKTIATGETYKQKTAIVKMLKKYFPTATIVDTTAPNAKQ